jgi:hypothetical protein
MFAKLFDKNKSKLQDEDILLFKCECGCNRYVHNKKAVCCNLCPDKHSAICERENVLMTLTVFISMKDVYDSYCPKMIIPICTITDMRYRLVQRLRDMVDNKFPKSMCRITVGSEDDTKLKRSDRLHEEGPVYIRGEVVNFKKELFTFIESFAKANSVEGLISYSSIEKDKEHCTIHVGEHSLRSQLYILACLEKGDFKYKVELLEIIPADDV